MKFNLTYLVVVFFLAACKQNNGPASEEINPLYTEPLSVALDTTNGYVFNPITGDSIKPLLNSFDDTIKTGIPIPFKGIFVNPDKISKPKIIKADILSKVTIESNVHPVPDKLEIIAADTTNIKTTKLGGGDQSHILLNSTGVVITGIPIPVTGKKMPLHEPKPVKALPLRFKDVATSNIQYLDVDQGLSYSHVLSILEDKNGYLWFGMDDNGVCKYDGVSFTNYTQKEGLTNNTVRSIIEDRKGNLWMGTYGGVSRFDGKNFTQYTEQDGLPNNKIVSILEDKKGNIWFRDEAGGITKYDGKNFINYSVKEGVSSDSIYAFLEDHQGNLWLGTSSGITKFDGNNFIQFYPKDGFNFGYVYSMLEDRNGSIWFGSYLKGVFKYDGKTFTHYSEKDGLSNNSIKTLMKDKKGNIWIGTRNGGINKFDGNNFTSYRIEQGLSNNNVSSIIEDSYGNIWAGTEGGGVNKLNDESFMQPVKIENLGNSRVRPMMKDAQGSLWFGTEAGDIYKYDGSSIANYSLKEVLSMHGLRSMLADREGNLWFGKTDEGGLYKYDGKQFYNFTTENGRNINNIMTILEDRKGVIWLCTMGGGVISFDGNRFTHYTEKDGFSSNRIFTILEDKKGNLWMGTEGGGVTKFDARLNDSVGQGNNIITYSEKEGLFCKSVTSIIEDKKGNLWFGTIGAGLCRFDGKFFTYFTEQQGLSYNDVWSIKEDAAGQLWVGTDKGLSLFIPGKDTLQRLVSSYSLYKFGLQDGLKATDFNLNSVCIDNNNHIWWGTGKAVVTLDLNNPFKVSGIHSLHLNYIEINGQFYDFRNLPDSINKKIVFSHVIPFFNYPENLKLTHDQNQLSFHFSAIDWSAPHKIKYSYRLIGLDNKWSSPSEEIFSNYNNLVHGNYEFQVKAIGQSQVWTKPFTYSFIIRPAWWQTWWFKASVFILAALIVLYIARLIYLSKLRKQKNLLEKQLAVQMERQRISSEMHDDIGAGLSGVRLLTEMTKNKMKDADSSTEVEKIYKSVGDISSKMKEVIWSLNTENDNLANLLSYIQKQTRLWLEHYPCQFTSEMPDAIPDIQVSGETRRNIFLIIKEAVHNIIKHSGASKVNLTMACTGGQLIIILSDNGKGIDAEQSDGAGNGMKNMRQRIQNLNGKIFIKNQEGLTLTFEIPLQPAI